MTKKKQYSSLSIFNAIDSKMSAEEENILTAFEERWYKSLEGNEPDFSIYDEENYLIELKKCWGVYSRKYLLAIDSPTSLVTKSIVEDIGNIESIVDLGCGAGYTTAGLKEIFPSAVVYGTNLKDSKQYDLAVKLSETHNFKMIPDVALFDKNCDLVFASEYFEHFRNPVDHLLEVLVTYKPKFLIIANSFNTKAIGHFDTYFYKGELHDSKKISRLFNKTLRDKGFYQVKTKLWNSRPSYWKKHDSLL